jgi:hypothetical protein
LRSSLIEVKGVTGTMHFAPLWIYCDIDRDVISMKNFLIHRLNAYLRCQSGCNKNACSNKRYHYNSFQFHLLTFLLFNIKTASSPIIANAALNPDNLLFSSDFSSNGGVEAVGVGDVIMVGGGEGIEGIVEVWIAVSAEVGVIGMVVGVCTGVAVIVVVGGVSGVDVGVCSIIFSILHVPLSTSVGICPEVEYNSSPSRSLMSSGLTPSSPIT